MQMLDKVVSKPPLEIRLIEQEMPSVRHVQDVERLAGAARPATDDLVALPLPPALQGDDAVEGALVVVGGERHQPAAGLPGVPVQRCPLEWAHQAVARTRGAALREAASRGLFHRRGGSRQGF